MYFSLYLKQVNDNDLLIITVGYRLGFLLLLFRRLEIFAKEIPMVVWLSQETGIWRIGFQPYSNGKGYDSQLTRK